MKSPIRTTKRVILSCALVLAGLGASTVAGGGAIPTPAHAAPIYLNYCWFNPCLYATPYSGWPGGIQVSGTLFPSNSSIPIWVFDNRTGSWIGNTTASTNSAGSFGPVSMAFCPLQTDPVTVYAYDSAIYQWMTTQTQAWPCMH